MPEFFCVLTYQMRKVPNNIEDEDDFFITRNEQWNYKFGYILLPWNCEKNYDSHFFKRNLLYKINKT